MKRYTVANKCWLTISLILFAVADLIIGVIRLPMEDGAGAFVAWVILANLCVISAGFLILRGEWFSKVIDKPFEETPEYVHVAKGVNFALKDELVRKQRYLKRIEEQQEGMLKEAIGGAALAGVGGLIFGLASTGVNLGGAAEFYVSYVSLTYPFLALGAAMLVMGGRITWHAFLNCDSSFSLWIAEKFTIETCSIRIRKETILIGVLTKRLEQEKIKEQKKKEEYLRHEEERMKTVVLEIPEEINLRG